VEDILGRSPRYPTICDMPDELIAQMEDYECSCIPDLPSGHSFEMCLPCKVRQDLERLEQDRLYAQGYIDKTEPDIPFRF
jgi:hypothetical protein